MGINIILPLIIGMALMVSLGSQVVPSFVEQMKIAKVENRTIANQNLIKDAIVRYIKMKKKVPKDLEELKTYGILKDYHESNIFGGGYSFDINKEKGTLTIFTTISDVGAGKYFSNSFKFPNKPTCKRALDSNGVCVSGEFETFYLLDEDTFKSIPIPTPPPPAELGSKEDILDKFKEDNIGNKKNKDGEEIVFDIGDKDSFLKDNEDGTFTIIEKEKQSDETWSNTGKETIISGNNIGKETGVEIKNIEVPQQMMDASGKRSIENKLFEKVVCRTPLDSNDKPTKHPKEGEEVFVVNENTGLGEIVWVALGSAITIQNKIFQDNKSSAPVVYTPNNICTSNISSMFYWFEAKTNFNSPLNRWDTSNVTNMQGMFYEAKNFNQPLNNWDVSKVESMGSMFNNAKSFNQPLNNWDVSSVLYMYRMFEYASMFNQDLNNWNVSNVMDMSYMFQVAKAFNKALDNWDVSNVIGMYGMFREASSFNKDIGNWVVSNVVEMNEMFYKASSFNQDLSGWCVENLSEPTNFDTGATSWSDTFKPQWGKSCDESDDGE